MYKITERIMTMEDFLKLKKIKPFKQSRSDAKSINFGAIFACSGPSLGAQMRDGGFDEKSVDEAIKTFSLENQVNAAILAQPGRDRLSIKYDLVGTKIRELFFNLYPSLLSRTEREQTFAKEHGYVRAVVGPVRHLHELRWMKKNANLEVTGADRMLYSKIFAHLQNDATNSPIQTAEVYQAMPNVTALWHCIKRMGLKSRIFNFVHDSQELYIHKDEREFMYAYLTALAEVDRQPYFCIPMHIDVEESDPNFCEIFREGREINIEKYDLHEELEKFNNKFGTGWKYEDIEPSQWIPRHGVLDTRQLVGQQYIPRKAKIDENGNDLEII